MNYKEFRRGMFRMMISKQFDRTDRVLVDKISRSIGFADASEPNRKR